MIACIVSHLHNKKAGAAQKIKLNVFSEGALKTTTCKAATDKDQVVCRALGQTY